MLKHSFPLQISTRAEMHYSEHSEIFKMLFQDVFNIFQTEKFTYGMNHVESCVENLQIFQSVLKTMLKISRLGSYCHDVTVSDLYYF